MENEAIDNQHRNLLAQCNALADCLADANPEGDRKFHEMFDELMSLSHLVRLDQRRGLRTDRPALRYARTFIIRGEMIDMPVRMIPIHELLARIRWDAGYAGSRFVIGYWDRVAGKVLHADVREIAWDADNPGFFDLVDEEGVAHGIPFHRVREVWRDGRLIWQRHPPGEAPA